MDGFAVRSAACLPAGTLRVTGYIAAGVSSDDAVVLGYEFAFQQGMAISPKMTHIMGMVHESDQDIFVRE